MVDVPTLKTTATMVLMLEELARRFAAETPDSSLRTAQHFLRWMDPDIAKMDVVQLFAESSLHWTNTGAATNTQDQPTSRATHQRLLQWYKKAFTSRACGSGRRKRSDRLGHQVRPLEEGCSSVAAKAPME